jgi:hypothetical protein
MIVVMKETFHSKSEAEYAMRRCEYPQMEIFYSKRQRRWCIRFTVPD